MNWSWVCRLIGHRGRVTDGKSFTCSRCPYQSEPIVWPTRTYGMWKRPLDETALAERFNDPVGPPRPGSLADVPAVMGAIPVTHKDGTPATPEEVQSLMDDIPVGRILPAKMGLYGSDPVKPPTTALEQAIEEWRRRAGSDVDALRQDVANITKFIESEFDGEDHFVGMLAAARLCAIMAEIEGRADR